MVLGLMLKVALSNLIPDCPGLQCSADPAAKDRSGWLGRMSNVLQFIEHGWLCTPRPQTLLHHIPLFAPRAEGPAWNRRKERIMFLDFLSSWWFQWSLWCSTCSLTPVRPAYWFSATPAGTRSRFRPFPPLYLVLWPATHPPLSDGIW